MADLNIRVIVGTKGAAPALEKVAGATDRVGRSAQKATRRTTGFGVAVKNMTSSLNFLRGAALAAAGAIGARQYINSITTFQNLNNRLKLVTNSQRELGDAMNTIIDISRQTRTDIGTTGTFYSRLALASQKLGLSQAELARLTFTVNKAVQLSGATAQESSAGLRQFSQGLASGRFQGDELRSVLENIPGLGRAIADGLGVTIGALREMGAQGELTPQIVIEALQRMGDQIDEDFGKLQPTIEQNWTVLSNNIAELFGKDSSIGVAIAETLGQLAEVVEFINDIGNIEVGNIFRGLGGDTGDQITALRALIADINRDLPRAAGGTDNRGFFEPRREGSITELIAQRTAAETRLGVLLAQQSGRSNQSSESGDSDSSTRTSTPEFRDIYRLPEFREDEQLFGDAYAEARRARDRRLNQQVPPSDFGGQGSRIGDQALAESNALIRERTQLENQLNQARLAGLSTETELNRVEFERQTAQLEHARTQAELRSQLESTQDPASRELIKQLLDINDTTFQDRMAQIQTDATNASDGVRNALAAMFDVDPTGLDRFEVLAKGLQGTLGGLSEQLVKGEISFKQFTRGILQSITQRIAAASLEFAAVSAIAAALSFFGGPQTGGLFLQAYYGRQVSGFNFLGGGGGVPAISSGDGVGPAVPRLHSGGRVSSGGRRRAGLRQGEVLAILEEGEMVIPNGNRATGGGRSPQVNINIVRDPNPPADGQEAEEFEARVNQQTGQIAIDAVIRNIEQGGSVAAGIARQFGLSRPLGA